MIAASNGQNLLLAERFAAAARKQGQCAEVLDLTADDFRALFNGRPVLTALRLQLAHLGAHVVGRQLVSNKTQPAKEDSIADLISRSVLA
jgi:hypothetical protein